MFGAGRSNVTLEEVDNFFRLQPMNTNSRPSSRFSGDSHTTSVPAYNISASNRAIPQPKSRGQLTDSSGNRVELKVEDENFLPRYMRQNQPEQDHDYAKIYQEEEEHKLLRDVTTPSIHGIDDPDIAGRLHDIDLDSVYSDTSHGIPINLIPPQGVDVYDRYEFEHEYNGDLPITNHQQEIVRTIESNPVTVISGSTGSGKTTQVPQYILDSHVDKNEYCNIVVTQPRRIAARSIAKRVCHERGWDLGTICGYQVGLEKPECSEDTRLLYCTTGTLLQKLITAKNMHQFTHVIIDEVHERDQDTDFLLVVVRKMLRTNSRHVKVILMSATMDCELFVKYFLVPVSNKLENAPLVNVEGKMYQVSEYYIQHLRSLGPLPTIEADNPFISEECMNLAFNLILEFDKLEEKEQGVNTSGFAENRGSILVFLPGLYDIEILHDKLNQVANRHRLTLVPLHSTISITEQIKVFDVPAKTYRKVILSTNIAESSITVPDIRYVIDFCLTKQLMADESTNYTSLQPQWCSKSSSNQRKGRAGRVKTGRVYRMVPQKFWNDHLSEYGVPEMQRCPLPHIVLNVKRLDMGEPKATLALCISPPNLNDIGKTILLLRGIGALRASDTGSPHDGELTFIGRALAQLPVDVRLGKLIIMGFMFGVLEECLIIAAASSLKSVFTKRFMKELQAYKNKLQWSAGHFCDSLAILDTFRTYKDHLATGYFRRSGNSEQSWCRKNSLQLARLKEISRLIEDLEQRLKRLNIHVPKPHLNPVRQITDPSDNRLILKIALCGAFYPNYFIQTPLDENDIHRAVSGHDPMRTVVIQNLPINQGIIYKDCIVELFKDCDKQLPVIHFEDTKAYIEFAPDEAHTTGKVHQGVYLAVKMRLSRKIMEINQFTQDEAMRRLSKVQLLADQQASNDGRLRTHRLTAADMHKSLKIPTGVQNAITIFVSEVIDCGHFWVQIATTTNYEDLREIQGWLNNMPLQPLTREIKSGHLVAAPYCDSTTPNSQYYRAQVYDVPSDPNVTFKTVQVFFVDFGNRATVQISDLRQLGEEVLLKPFQAVECFLCEVKPSVAKSPNGEWSRQANQLFKQFIALQKPLYGTIYSQVGATVRLVLEGYWPDPETGTRKLTKFHDLLIERSLADRCEEGIASRQNHMQRQIEGDSPNLIDTVPHNFMPVNVETMAQGTRRGRRITLRGPSSPLEMSFNSLCHAGKFREVRIENGSVNHVAIDDDPHDPVARLMVASFVGLSATSSHMVAHNTTILPHIPGLPAIMALLFCPTAEIRTDPQMKKLIGAICGLGAEDEDSHYPLYSDEDMEITFDTKISLTDLSKINGVRMAMNIAIGSDDNSISWDHPAIFRIQESARDCLLQLVKKNRKPLDMCDYKHPHHWNMVNPDDVIPHSMQVDPKLLYKLHNAVHVHGVGEDSDEEDELSSIMS